MKQKPNYDFSVPNKLERKALWLVLAKASWAIFRGFWPVLAIFAFRGFPTDSTWIYVGALAILLLTFGKLFINYFYYTYQIIGDELVIQKGWLNKSKTVVKFDKIHEVNLNQQLIHKIIGLYLIKVDTAGSADTEITINGVDYHKALAFKEVITKNKTQVVTETDEVIAEPTNDVTTDDDEKIVISLKSLIKIGLTRNYLQTIGLLIAFSFQIIEQAKDLFYNEEDDYGFLNNIFDSFSPEQFIGIIGIMLLLGLIIFVVIFNLVRTLLSYYNYLITIKDKNLTVSYGLTDSHIIAVPSKKVQLFEFQQNYFQKWMNLFEIKIQQVESSEKNKKKKGLIVPGANRAELNKIFSVIFQKPISTPTDYIQPHPRILLLKFFWLCIPAAIALGVLYFTDFINYAWTILPFFVFFYFLIYRSYVNEKLFIQDDFIVLKKGVWDIKTTYLQINKAQQIKLRQSYFQEGRQLGTLSIYTAGGAITLFFYDYKKLSKLSNDWLYQIEKNIYPWM